MAAVTVKEIVQVFRDAVEGDVKATDMLRGAMSGLSPEGRKFKIGAIYTEARTVGGILTPARELSERDRRVYGKIREAFSSLFGPTKGKRAKKKAAKIAVPTTAQAVIRMAKAAQAALGKMEKATYSIPQASAAWAALAAVCAKKV